MPHVQEGMKADGLTEAPKQLADTTGDLERNVDPDPPPQTLVEKITDPVTNLFKGGEENCLKKEAEYNKTGNLSDGLKK